jgi:hypothetical protein
MDKKQQAKLLSEIMQADDKDGLYKQQTAVEWLQEVIINHLSHEQQMQVEGLFQQAKAKEKEQTEAAYHDGVDDARNNSIKYAYYKDKKKNIHIERSPEWP